ncbi:MAG TPA: VIT1/CCC1 transporter family protein [Clostridia bacterium]|nr:VIT1/CCC1 transporter family protein [Clostridia bacterium]
MNERELMQKVRQYQSKEILEKHVYIKIAACIKNEADKNTLLHIAEEEQRHYDIWKRYTGTDVGYNKLKAFYYVLLARVLGYTFAIKRMESPLYKENAGETLEVIEELEAVVPDVKSILSDEEGHEKSLIEIIDEEKLKYVGSIVLGLNDALVEFTGSLAGWTFAMQSNRLIALAGLITGVSATLSMASSEYLSVRHEEGGKNAFRSATYTGIAYLFTVVLLLLPYLVLADHAYFVSLAIMLAIVVLVIAAFNYYVSVTRTISFKKKFSEMCLVSLSVAAVSFVIGLLVKRFLGIDL